MPAVGDHVISCIGDFSSSTPSCELHVAGTGAIEFPAGTTAQRPSSNTTGMIRYNTSTDNHEYNDGTSWKRLWESNKIMRVLIVGGGGGGGGGTNGAGGNGGSGVVIFRLPTSGYSVSNSGLTMSSATVDSDTVWTITAGSGTVTIAEA